ncbi:asparagine synthase-domain-containing protein [Vararia minispora EC-137]|uniref:Asparagine synthase-domain-containing protein n=1 Tax=Vararia minispora EC-137 TaxID=1314806 RepID=A0ACB8QXQ3_9AGAM|nr:asparagine synthase-domain-containing protein [Vararia minispora EC-137]
MPPEVCYRAWTAPLRVARRRSHHPGPDAQRTHTINLSGPDGRDLSVYCYSSELLLRGDALIVQPHINPTTGDTLCWNGEASFPMYPQISIRENDGARLFAALGALPDPALIPTILGKVEGPYALAYFHNGSRRLFFGRDPLGRRSLLMHAPTKQAPYFFLSSASAGERVGYEVAELDTHCFYELDLGALLGATDFICVQRRTGSHCLQAIPARVNRTLPSESERPFVTSLDEIPPQLSSAVDGLISRLDRSVRLRIENIPKNVSLDKGQLAVLFSGGIDSTVITFLAHRHVPLDEPIDLLNVAFENPRKIQVKRQGNVGGMPKRERRALMIAEKDNLAANRSDQEADYLVPDRETGLQQVEELRRLCPERQWNFVEINVPFAEAQVAREEVEAFMWPRRTVMDLSLAMALFFAARGVGQVRDNTSHPYQPYKSPAKVLLNGLGSDELLGGYGRHRAAYKTGGWQGVVDELQLEIDRIPSRNMGRDDRVISSHGKETRHPFLSLDVVAFLAGLPVNFKMDPRLDVGLGDKMLLRLAARKLGLLEASIRKKRAMQFGSHSARMENGTPNAGGELLLK